MRAWWILVAAALSLSVPLSLPSTAAAQGQETFVYIVQPGENCTMLARRFYGTSRYQIILKYNDLGPAPHHLTPGQTLILPRPDFMREDKGADARVSHKKGAVQARPPEEEAWRQARSGMDLFRSWRVNTLEEAFARLTFRDLSAFSMRENTLVVIFGGTSSELRRQKMRAELERGTLRHHLDALAGGQGVELVTPSSESELGEGSALVSVEPETGTTRVANHQGADARVYGRDKDGRRMKKPVKVAQGMGSKVKKGQRPGPPRPLPPAPAWRGSGSRLGVATFAGKARAVEVLWEPEPKASQYLVQLSADPLGQEVYQAALAKGDADGAQVRDLEPGVWWLRVSSIDDDAFEGAPSAPAELVVVPMEMLDPLGEPWVHPKQPDLAPEWVWSGSQLRVPRGALCRREGSSAPASRLLTLSTPGEARLLCSSDSGIALAPILTQVRPVEGQLLTEQLPATLPRGQRFQVPVQLPDGAEPYLEVKASPGVITWPLQRDAEGGWSLEVLIKEDAPSPVELSLVGRAVALEGAAPLSSLRRQVDMPTEALVQQQVTGPDGLPVGSAAATPDFVWSLELVLGGSLHLVPTGLGFGAEPSSQINPGLRLGLEMGRHFALEVEGRGGVWSASLEPGAQEERVALAGLRAAALLHLGGERWRPFVSLGRGTDWLLGTPAGYQGSDTVSATQLGLGLKFLPGEHLLWRVELRQALTQGRVDTLGTATEAALSLGWRW